MTTKIKKGYEWVEEQEDLWESAASEKMNLLDELANTHLEWFDKHSTISDILAWKSPIKESTSTATTTKKESKLRKLKAVIHIPLFDEDSITEDEDNNRTYNSIQKLQNKSQVEKVEAAGGPMDDDQIVFSSQPKAKESKQQVTAKSTDSKDYQPIQSDTSDNTTQEFQQLQAEDRSAIAKIRKRELNTRTPALSPKIISDEEKDIVARTSKISQSPYKKKEKPSQIKEGSAENTEGTSRKSSLNDDNGVVPMDIDKLPSPSANIANDDGISEDEYPVKLPDLVMDTDTQNATQSQPVKTPEAFQHQEDEDEIQLIISNRKQQQQHKEEVEDDDEIQLVVSNRSNLQQQDEEVRSTGTTFMKSSPTQPSVISPPSSVPPLPTKVLSPARHPSPFMSKLFQMGQPSNHNRQKLSFSSAKEDSPAPKNFITARPKGSVSTSSISSDISNSRSMSLLDNKSVRKRSLVSVPEPLVVSEIEVSESLPGARFKKSRTVSTVSLKKSKTPSVHRTSNTNIPAPESETSKSVDNNKVEGNEEAKDEKQEEPIYLIPTWAKSPELEALLIKQAGLDPDMIFGRIAPLQIQDVFSGPFN